MIKNLIKVGLGTAATLAALDCISDFEPEKMTEKQEVIWDWAGIAMGVIAGCVTTEALNALEKWLR